MKAGTVIFDWIKPLGFVALALLFWWLRSWNLNIGDGMFCCKLTISEQIFEITYSRSFLSYLLYRAMFFTLHPLLNWWVEDIIALSSCAAGLLFFWALFRLSEEAGRNRFERWIIILFPSTTLIFQIFCGHIEYYSWTNAFMMCFAYYAWKTLHHNMSPLYAASALALAAAFHSSGVFYFPALLFLPWLRHQRDGRIVCDRTEWQNMAWFFVLFLLTTLLHRESWLYLGMVIVVIPAYFAFIPFQKRAQLAPWMMIYLPWFILFTVRASLDLRAEPLIEHLPPIMEPYDHGAYLYTAFSWDHLYDKTMFHVWLAPFGLLTFIILGGWHWKTVVQNRWLLFLVHFCAWTMVWTLLFYPQLRTRDWDLFAGMSIPLNLTALFLMLRYLLPVYQKIILPVAVMIHLIISVPIILENAQLLKGRGYATLRFDSRPVSAEAYVRSLKVGVTPSIRPHIRSGAADIRMVPTHRDYLSWSEEVEIEPGQDYTFKTEFPPR